MIPVSPTRMEPALIDMPGPALLEKAEHLLHEAARLESCVPQHLVSPLRSALCLADAVHSCRIENILISENDLVAPVSRSPEASMALRLAEVRGQVDSPAHGPVDPSLPDVVKALHAGLFEGDGGWRSVDVAVGEHVPPPHERVAAFMEHFHRRYRTDWLHGARTRVLAVPASHHRLMFIHPFEDGNGRVARLFSHGMLHLAGAGAGGLWSLSRGLCRGLDPAEPEVQQYHRMMALGDRPRQGERDGRGNLSLAALESLSSWFLDVCLSEVTGMASLIGSDQLSDRLRAALVEDGRDDLWPAAATAWAGSGAELLDVNAIRDLVRMGFLDAGQEGWQPFLSVGAARRLLPELF